jgi:predicted transcriptional regulator of viral defense system
MSEQYKYLEAYLDEQRSNGQYSFTTEKLHDQLGISENALKKSLQRLKTQESVVMVRKGFYVIVPPEYKAKGIIPTSLYVNELMKFLDRDYYVGIALRSIQNDKVSITFHIKKSWNRNNIVQKKVDTGYIKISSPELTALDLVSYYQQVGGLNRVATVLEELREVIQAERLKDAASHYEEIAAIQRLGYLLEYVLADKELSDALYEYLGTIDFYTTLLRREKEKPESMATGNRWKIVPNTEIEADI